MTYIPYIYILKPNGFIEQTKLKKELDLSSLIVGENITSFYNETFPLYNIYLQNEDKSHSLFKENKLIHLSQTEICEEIFSLFNKLLNQVVSSECNSLLNDYIKEDGVVYRDSVFKEYLQSIKWNSGIDFMPEKEDFSLESYKEIANELLFLSECVDNNPKLQYFIKSSVKSFNTFLAYEGIIQDFSHGLFETDKNDDTGESCIYFGTATKPLYYAQRICDSSFSFNTKIETKKLKI